MIKCKEIIAPVEHIFRALLRGIAGVNFLTFATMACKALKNIVILVSLLAVSCFSTSKIWAAPGAEQVKNETLADPSQQFPHGELERIQHSSVPGWNITAPKNLVPPALSSGTIIYYIQVFFKISLVQTSSLRIKDYLHHIHPSHHFW